MKTVQDWLSTLQIMQDLDREEWPTVNDSEIHAIQKDAYNSGLLRAAQVCRDVSSLQGLKARAVVADGCAHRIEAEAKGGQ